MDRSEDAGLVSLISVVVDAATRPWVEEQLLASQAATAVQYRMHLSEHWSQHSHIAVVQQADHLVSTAVLFAAVHLESLAVMYLDWTSSCGKILAIEQIKPMVYLYCHTDGMTSKAFLEHCMQQAGAGARDFTQLLSDSFQGPLNVSSSSSMIGDLRTAVRIGRRQRAALGHCWDRVHLEWIREKYTHHCEENVGGVFSMASVLTNRHPALGPGSVFRRLFSCRSDDRTSRGSIITLLGSYLAHHARKTRYWKRIKTAAPRPTSKSYTHFARHHFDRQYCSEVQAIWRLDETRPTLRERRSLTDQVFLEWYNILHGRVEGPASLSELDFETHLHVLEDHAAVLVKWDFGTCCASCLAHDWNAILPCGRHGYCNDCLKQLDRHWRASCTARVLRCSVCQRDLDSWAVKVYPAAATGRVLGLDGGGVRGLVQLEILFGLQKEIGLDVPLATFFDLVVGTSVGGIVGLGLCIKRWSVQECRDRLQEVLRKVFSPPRGIVKIASSFAGGWSGFIYKAFRIWALGGIYGSKPLEEALQQTFGQDEFLMAPRNAATNVAVTTTTSGDPPCKLLTSYRLRASSEMSTYTTWSEPGCCKVWEAARATSAAPLFFSGIRLNGRTVRDGGVHYMNPTGIGRREIAKLFGGAMTDHLTVSVGCGNTKLATEGERVLEVLWNAICYKVSPAQEELEKSLWADQPANYIRLDAQLDSGPIALDSIDCVLQIIQNSHDFMNNLRLRNDISDCAWRLVAATFFCDVLEDDLSQPNDQSVSVALYCRLGDAVRSLFQRWPQAYFTMNGVSISVSAPSLPLLLPLSLAEHSQVLNVELVANDKRSSICGFPIRLVDLMARLEVEVVWNESRKRKLSNMCD